MVMNHRLAWSCSVSVVAPFPPDKQRQHLIFHDGVWGVWVKLDALCALVNIHVLCTSRALEKGGYPWVCACEICIHSKNNFPPIVFAFLFNFFFLISSIDGHKLNLPMGLCRWSVHDGDGCGLPQTASSTPQNNRSRVFFFSSIFLRDFSFWPFS